ncbi:D-glycerate dehydrogenase [Neobacillus cucumis]|uniref:2-hydroxyacid dehydrogenase n=1 Tax=Neobacillus cucumis TaxID=1740721 RepID=UPI0018E027B7|nr:D-glycerate dehydrogenase [Neobacillus cucumis]MBI0580726.1 D-glycerate dehydrogenase [Neobacillus cucumis]
MKPKIFTTVPLPEKVEKNISEYCEIDKWTGDRSIPRHILLEKIKDVVGLYSTGVGIDEELLRHAPNLKIVSNVSVGYNNFDLEAMKRFNVIGTNTPYVLDESVADLTFALILNAARRISELDRMVKEGQWGKSDDDKEYFGVDVNSTKLGIIGMGRIGKALARRAKLGFNMDVLYYNRNRKLDVEEEYGVKYADLQSLLEHSDFVVLLTPLTPDTYHLIGEKEFKLMKKSAFFINVSRGQTVDEQALISALQNKEIKGAGLDVFTKEPIEPKNLLLQLNNVVVTPHIGSATERTREDMAVRAAQNLVAVVTGKDPIDRVI